MSCLIFCAPPYASGRAVAGKVASRLDYELIEAEIFRDAASASGIAEETLVRALGEPLSLFGPSMGLRRKALAHVGASLATRLLKDRVVYTGPLGHLLISGISHVVKVRVVAEWRDRVATKAEREGVDAVRAEQELARQEREFARLTKRLFGVEGKDESLFDVQVSTSDMSVEEAAQHVADVSVRDRYRPMTYSMRCMENLELSYRTQACLVDLDPEVEAEAEAGHVIVRSRRGSVLRNKKLREMRERAKRLEGVKSVAVYALEDRMGQKWGPA